MKIYLAAFSAIEKYYKLPIEDVYILSSFWEHKGGKFGDYVYQEKHMLDSGAYGAIKKGSNYVNFDWDKYVKKYIDFIKLTEQKLFMELDIDNLIGLKKVEYYREQIADAVGTPPIPCWHANRGVDYFIKMCEEYPYVAIGTTNATETGRKIRRQPEVLGWFIQQAHNKDCKIHGLGFTSLPWLPKLDFDSVDSTSWITRGGYGKICYFLSNTKLVQEKPKNVKVKDSPAILIYNFKNWIKFQKYAEINL